MFFNKADDAYEFHERFARFHGLLYFVAARVLDGSERAEEAVDNCFFTASCNPQKFKYEGDFRSWLVRILIAEALQILHQKRTPPFCFAELPCAHLDRC